MRAMRLICDVRFKGETRERRESRDPGDVTECAYTAAAPTHGVKSDAPAAKGVGIRQHWPRCATLGPAKM